MDKISELILEMIDFDAENPQRIQHFIKVHEFSPIAIDRERIFTELFSSISKNIHKFESLYSKKAKTWESFKTSGNIKFICDSRQIIEKTITNHIII